MVAAWSVDRLGRSLTDLLGSAAGAARQGRRPVSASAGARHLDTLRPRDVSDDGRICRVRDVPSSASGSWPAWRRAKAEGTRLGRQPTVTNDAAKVRAIQSDRAAGKSLREIAQVHGVGHTTVARICAEAAP